MEEVFTAEFVVHEVSCSLPYISKPAITIRFLEFPTLTIFGSVQKVLIFNKGKSCKFSMTLTTLRASLKRYPLYIMLVDALPNNIKMLGTAAVDLSAFADCGISTCSDFKRNVINLHDPIKNAVAKLDLSISISQYTDGITRTPNEVFEKINYENLKVTPIEKQVEIGIGTDPMPLRMPGKNMTTTSTMTIEKTEAKEVQTSVFQENYSPPPMFFTKSKVPTRPAYYPTVPPSYNQPVIEGPSSDMLIDKLINEIQQLKQVSALQQNWSYPPVMTLKQPEQIKNTNPSKESLQESVKSSSRSERNSKKSSSRDKKNYEGKTVKPGQEAPLVASSSSVLSQSRAIKESTSEYTEDFEEESIVKSSSREGFTKCYVCGEFVKISEAKDHPNNCKKIREKISPRGDSGDTWGRDAMKSVNSIAEVYDSDFEECSESISSNR
ncbi:hypothetical protein SteCoe_6114 [Stentor coeruleus]|uniref:Uncharacterized protein n=1 Tax=Stentor coeruleus TaxID=5963 RepID=A0A1R2CQR3_9CILI|nr:hypothetical protein SteCoe_6114 [Stentor coeruleus]